MNELLKEADKLIGYLKDKCARYEAMTESIDTADFAQDVCIKQFNHTWLGEAYDEDGTILRRVEHHGTALDAYEDLIAG